MRYVIRKEVEAKDIKEALRKEKSAEVKEISCANDEPEQRPVGF